MAAKQLKLVLYSALKSLFRSRARSLYAFVENVAVRSLLFAFVHWTILRTTTKSVQFEAIHSSDGDNDGTGADADSIRHA
jgi:hypothetical protein